jgi:hypothetical protein
MQNSPVTQSAPQSVAELEAELIILVAKKKFASQTSRAGIHHETDSSEAGQSSSTGRIPGLWEDP